MAGMKDIGTFLDWFKAPLYILLLCRLLSVRKYNQPEPNRVRRFFASQPLKYFLVVGLSSEIIRDILKFFADRQIH
jgi:hypothetical protein